MFTSPPEQSLEWSESSVEGASRFLKKIWSLIENKTYKPLIVDDLNFDKKDLELRQKSHATLKKVENDYEKRFSFNTAIAAIMELQNFIPDEYKNNDINDSSKFCVDEAIIFILKMLSPIAPHICEHLWKKFNYDDKSIESWWPKFEEELLEVEEFELIIQVNGKVRGKTIIEKNRPQDEIENIASQLENVKAHIGDNEIKKSIYVKDKLINFVI
jgi:leucyl-tRNA synthetase